MTRQRRVVIGVIYLAIVAGVWLGASNSRVHSWWADMTKPKLPAAENASPVVTNSAVNQSTNANANVSATIPLEKNLAVPFTSQAPDANWDADHQEFCEEAAMLMVARFYQGRGFANTADKEKGLQEIKTWEVKNLGFYFDTTAGENARILEGLYGFKVTRMIDPTVEQITAAVAAGHPVIVPSAGRELGNPNFTGAGPIYHNLVIRGYTKDGKFITNDPGTRKGEQYIYDQDVVMAAIHDWVPKGDRTIAANGDVANGQRVVLVISQGVTQ